jgi:hypothetical protein
MFKKMKPKEWQEKNGRLNKDTEITAGHRVIDLWGRKGLVTEVVVFDEISPIENHGCITCLLDEGIEEHYSHYGWQKMFRLIE